MRLVYTADLHGEIASYRALLDLAVAFDAQAAIVGGDLLPHTIRLASAISRQRAFIEQQLRPLFAAFHLAHPAIAIYLLAGNDDWAAAISTLADLEQSGLVHPLHNRVYSLAGQGAVRWLAGYACIPPTPFSIKDFERCDEGRLLNQRVALAYTSWSGEVRHADNAAQAQLPSIADDLTALVQQSDPTATIYVCHVPPADTALDQMYHRRHIGSWAVRRFIERCSPPLTLHGHVHEAPRLSGHYAIQLGTTWCINPGHDPKRFSAVTLDTDDIAASLQHTLFGRPR